jgi:hypothetical protein
MGDKAFLSDEALYSVPWLSLGAAEGRPFFGPLPDVVVRGLLSGDRGQIGQRPSVRPSGALFDEVYGYLAGKCRQRGGKGWI